MPDGKRYLPYFVIFSYVVFVAGLFFFQSVRVQSLAASSVFVVFLTAIPFKKMRRGIFPITLFLLFTFAGNLFFHSGKIIYDNGIFSVTDEGIRMAGVRTLRIFSMIFGAKILTAVLSMDEIVRCFENLLKPFERIGVPVKDFFLITGLTLKSFPLLMDYLSRAYKEDTAKNNVRGFRMRLRHLAMFLMPVFVKSIRSPESFFESDRSKE